MSKMMVEIEKVMDKGPLREWWRDSVDAGQLFSVLWNKVTEAQIVEAKIRSAGRNKQLGSFLHKAAMFVEQQGEWVRVSNRDGLFEVSRLEWAIEVLAMSLNACAEAGFHAHDD